MAIERITGFLKDLVAGEICGRIAASNIIAFDVLSTTQPLLGHRSGEPWRSNAS